MVIYKNNIAVISRNGAITDNGTFSIVSGDLIEIDYTSGAKSVGTCAEAVAWIEEPWLTTGIVAYDDALGLGVTVHVQYTAGQYGIADLGLYGGIYP
jgi:hypothetical protein